MYPRGSEAREERDKPWIERARQRREKMEIYEREKNEIEYFKKRMNRLRDARKEKDEEWSEVRIIRWWEKELFNRRYYLREGRNVWDGYRYMKEEFKKGERVARKRREELSWDMLISLAYYIKNEEMIDEILDRVNELIDVATLTLR